ncbi:MAG TPA: glycoside hydrolase family 16 protein [Chitinivibrionales bacterium]|nr:glycoside hydrolase family 16 protein [Chitinivibrionales bacterium]
MKSRTGKNQGPVCGNWAAALTLTCCVVLLIILCPHYIFAADPQPPGTVPLPAGMNSWKLILNENFDSTSYDTSRWNPYADWGGVGSFNNGRENYYPSQIQVNSGVCHLVAQPNPGVTTFSNSYKSGELISARANTNDNTPYKFSFLYGYIEARLKIVDVSGFFGAFWMLPCKKNYTYEWEIDILEVLGNDPRTMWMHYSWSDGLTTDVSRNKSWTPNTGVGNNGTGPAMDFSKVFHTIGVDWEPDHLTFYLDGTAAGTFPSPGANNSNIARTPGYILIQQMVENDWCRAAACTLQTAGATDTFDIDYVRVWQGTTQSGARERIAPGADESMSISCRQDDGGTVFFVKNGARRLDAVNIYDDRGRLVRRLSGGNPRWDGADAHSIRVKPGLYLYAAECAGTVQKGMFLRVR